MKIRFYLQFDERGSSIRVSKRYPLSPRPGCVMVKITLDVDPAVFKPLQAFGVVGADAVEVIPVQVEQPEAPDAS